MARLRVRLTPATSTKRMASKMKSQVQSQGNLGNRRAPWGRGRGEPCTHACYFHETHHHAAKTDSRVHKIVPEELESRRAPPAKSREP